jgi:hypothetical protein
MEKELKNQEKELSDDITSLSKKASLIKVASGITL